MTNPITGPWPTPSTQPPSADELRNGILAVLVYKRGLHKANESLERVRDRRRFCRRCLRKAKLMADIDWLRSLNAQHDAAEIAINEITAMISTNAEALLHLLSTLDKHLDRHQAGALLGIDHRHVERAGGLLHAATGDPHTGLAVGSAMAPHGGCAHR